MFTSYLTLQFKPLFICILLVIIYLTLSQHIEFETVDSDQEPVVEYAPLQQEQEQEQSQQRISLFAPGIVKQIKITGGPEKPPLPIFSNKRDELLFWVAKQGNQHIIQTHLAEVAACVMVKDEHLDIMEWIAYHRYIGIGKFYIYDNNSVPPMIDMLRFPLSRGFVEYQYINDTFLVDDYLITRKYNEYKRNHKYWGTTELVNSVQVWAMTNCVRNYADRHKWIVLIDVDEFLIFTQPKSNPPHLPTFLQPYEESGGLAVYRRTFGSSGFINRPAEGVLTSYTECVEHLRTDLRQAYPKIILNTQFFQKDGECRVHECSTTRKFVNTYNNPLDHRWWIASPTATWNKLLVHHYAVKSFEDFKFKQHRGMPHSRSIYKDPKKQSRSDSFFNNTDDMTDFECLEAVEYGQACCKKAVAYSTNVKNRLKKYKLSTFYQEGEE
eukprot:TRINITY_DN7416_c0_g3_i4.p1 TRINITY_DN7416_c0_g3~~TRINITY_DN7416_c0_g3_i4.p1  ORF type:complete len:439 (+),score=32.90 TRINITY_DN7416_c0_g3_i4:1494-2810(+)